MSTDQDGNYLLRRIDQKLDVLGEKLELKADREALHKLQSTIAAQHLTMGQRIDALADRLAKVERHDYAADLLAANATMRFTKREKTIGATVALVAAAGTVVNIVIALNVYQ